MKKTGKYTIEDFIFNQELVDLVKKGDQAGIDLFLSKFPDAKDLISDAVVLLRNLKIKEDSVPEEQVEEDLLRLQALLHKDKQRHIVWYKWSAAAVIFILISLSCLYYFSQSFWSERDSMFAMLDSLDTHVETVHIIAGDVKAEIGDNAMIRQTAVGDIVVGHNEKLKSDDIKSEVMQLVVPYGKHSKIRFSDGTVVWANSGTKLIYPKQFEADKREIYLDGEIYLEVAKDEERPFRVISKKVSIEVLGTKFNVNAYNTKSDGSVVLVEGSVKVVSKKDESLLKPNQGFFYEPIGSEVRDVDVYPYICWKDGIMELEEEESLQNILDVLSEYYHVSIKCDCDVSNEIYKGKINIDGSLEEVLYNLSQSTAFTYTKKGDSIYISCK